MKYDTFLQNVPSDQLMNAMWSLRVCVYFLVMYVFMMASIHAVHSAQLSNCIGNDMGMSPSNKRAEQMLNSI